MTTITDGDLDGAALKVFETVPDLYLILSKELRILTATNAYLAAIGKTRADIVGKYIFDVFPLDPEAPNESGIKLSLERVLATRKPNKIPVFRFDTPAPGDKSVLLERYWDTSHTPVLSETGIIQYIIHQTHDVSGQVIAEQSLKKALEEKTRTSARFEQVSRQMQKLMAELPARVAILSGPDFVFEYVNPYYYTLFPDREVLNKPLLEALPELVDSPVLDELRKVYTTGQSFEGKEMLIPIAHAAGERPTEHYFNFIYQARYDENEKIIGVLSFAYDITEIVVARKNIEQSTDALLAANARLAQANEEVQASSEEIQTANEELKATNEELFQAQDDLRKLNSELEQRVEQRAGEALKAQEESERQRDRLKRFFMQAPAGICVLDGEELVFELVNPPYQELFPGRDLLGKPLAEALPEFEGHEIWHVLLNVYRTGKTFEGNEIMVPLARKNGGPVEERYFSFIYQARHDADGKVDGVLVFVFELTETVLNRNREQESEKRFRFLLNAMPQQVWTAQPDGSLDYVNQVVCSDFGYNTADVVGSGWQGFIHPEDLENCMVKWQTALETGDEYMVEFRLRMANGNYVWHLGRAVPLIEDGKIKFWLGTNTNIDIQKSNEQRKDEFLSIASHELKTPLTSIKAFNQLMQRADDYIKIRNYVNKSAEHILRLEKLINDLLDVTKINAGKMIYNMQPFSFLQMLRDSIESVQHIAGTHEIALENADDITYSGDRFRLEQVVNNFLNNAIKYSPEGKRVIVNCEIQQGNIIVSVQDFGIGIAPQDLSRLFERYYRVDNTAMRFEGLGLGLFISSEILKRHQGSFWIESQPNEGSTFYFRLPAHAVVEQPVIRDRDKFYQDSTITISYNEIHHRLDVDWTGFQNLQTIQKGAVQILRMIRKNEVYKALNDNTHVLGNWSEAADWAGQVFFPQLEEAGIKFLAWVYSPSTFSQLSAQKSVDVAVGNIVTQLFTEYSEADNWINSK